MSVKEGEISKQPPGTLTLVGGPIPALKNLARDKNRHFSEIACTLHARLSE